MVTVFKGVNGLSGLDSEKYYPKGGDFFESTRLGLDRTEGSPLLFYSKAGRACGLNFDEVSVRS